MALSDPERKLRRERHVEQILGSISIEPFDLAQARHHARIWADLQMRGQMIGPHDLLIAAAALALDFELATLNFGEFQRVHGLRLRDATSFLKQ
jgi:tRNA(fMet)-specific endonuclease VapC